MALLCLYSAAPGAEACAHASLLPFHSPQPQAHHRSPPRQARRELNDEKFELITFKNAFHGRTMATISASNQEKMHKGFNPLLPGFKYVEFDDLEGVKAAIGPNTAGFLVEPVQGEGGIRVASQEFLQGLRKLADEPELELEEPESEAQAEAEFEEGEESERLHEPIESDSDAPHKVEPEEGDNLAPWWDNPERRRRSPSSQSDREGNRDRSPPPRSQSIENGVDWGGEQPFRRRDCEIVESADGSASEGGAAEPELEEEEEEKIIPLSQKTPRKPLLKAAAKRQLLRLS